MELFQERTCHLSKSKTLRMSVVPYRKYSALKNDGFKTKKRYAQRSMVMTTVRPRKSLLFQAPSGNAVEWKNYDIQTTFAAPLTASFATPQLIFSPAQGSNNSERTGRKVVVRTLQWRGIFAPAGAVSQYRVLVIYDKQSNGAGFSKTDVVQTDVFHSPLNLGFTDRFVVLCDTITNPCQSSALNMTEKVYKKLKLETTFIGLMAAIASIGTGAIWMMVANNSDPTIGQVSSVYMYTRIRYTDV